MKKLKTFFYVLKNSIVSPKYYRDVINTKIGFSIKYFLLLAAFSSLIFSIVISIKAVPEGKKLVISLTDQIKSMYPEDLIINFKDGAWNINKEEPYIIPLPKNGGDTSQATPQDTPIENLVVFSKSGTIEDLEKYKTLIILNEKNIIYQENLGKVTSQPIGEVPDFSLDKTKVNDFADKAYKYLKVVPYFIPLIIFVFYFLFSYLVEGLFQVLFAGFVIYLLSLIRKSKLSYKQSCQMIIHTMTIPILLQIIVTFLPTRININGWFFVLNILIAAIFMVRMEKDDSLVKIEKTD